eukprot:g38943.t1
MGHFEIKKEVVLDLLKSIKVNKAPGPNVFYPRLLREAREEIARALTKIFVSSLATGEFPKDWQVANVVPLFKKGNRDNSGNQSPHYRKDVEALERVKKWFTRMLPGLEGMSYKERLEKLGSYSLEQRRLMGDLIEVYKIMRCIDR